MFQAFMGVIQLNIEVDRAGIISLVRMWKLRPEKRNDYSNSTWPTVANFLTNIAVFFPACVCMCVHAHTHSTFPLGSLIVCHLTKILESLPVCISNDSFPPLAS